VCAAVDVEHHARQWPAQEITSASIWSVMDDATSEICYARFVEEESTASVVAALGSVVEAQGVFCSLYSDRASHFVFTPTGATNVSETLTERRRAVA
jgi:hypothetical protein